MKNSFADYLVPCATQVLETMFFTAAEQGGQPICPQLAGALAIARTVNFSGPPDGELCLCARLETAAALASSFLGLAPDEVSPSECGHVAGELANMICGSVLSSCAPQGAFRLQVSECTACGEACDFGVSLELPQGSLNICARLKRL